MTTVRQIRCPFTPRTFAQWRIDWHWIPCVCVHSLHNFIGAQIFGRIPSRTHLIWPVNGQCACWPPVALSAPTGVGAMRMRDGRIPQHDEQVQLCHHRDREWNRKWEKMWIPSVMQWLGDAALHCTCSRNSYIVRMCIFSEIIRNIFFRSWYQSKCRQHNLPICEQAEIWCVSVCVCVCECGV